jgi:hypothetical protein
MRTTQVSTSVSFIFLTGALGILLVAYLLIPLAEIEATGGLQVANSLAAAVVLFQGILVLRIVWNLEMVAGGGVIPFAGSLLSAQHLMFGLGGMLVALSSRNYFYSNEQGEFSWDRAVLPFLLAHAVALNAGMLGVFVATRGRRRKTPPVLDSSGQIARWNVWSWDDTRTICSVSLAMHGVFWLFLIPLHTRLPDAVNYVSYGFAQSLNAAYVLWGLSWARCRNRQTFIIYTACFVLLTMLLGQRGEALAPLLFFGIGYLASPAGRKWNWRLAVRWLPWAMPLLLFFYWISLASEDMRHVFVRGSLNGVGDAIARVESMLSGDSTGTVYETLGSGEDVNGPFRFGARLFELSGADLVTRTPDAVPYWGWSSDDTTVLMTGFLPLKLNPDAAYNNNPDAGVLFLQRYGWSYVDPTKGNSMPATMVGDAWRRFGWAGVIVAFFCFCWAEAKITVLLRSSPWQPAMAIFSAAFLTYYMTAYDAEMIYLINGVPRRIVITAAYAGVVYVLGEVFGGARARAGARSGRRTILARHRPAY